MKNVSGLIKAMPPSGIRQVMELATKMQGVIHLEVGEPSFKTPNHIIDAAFAAAIIEMAQDTPRDRGSERPGDPNGQLQLFFRCAKTIAEQMGARTNAQHADLHLEAQVIRFGLDLLQVRLTVTFVNFKV